MLELMSQNKKKLVSKQHHTEIYSAVHENEKLHTYLLYQKNVNSCPILKQVLIVIKNLCD